MKKSEAFINFIKKYSIFFILFFAVLISVGAIIMGVFYTNSMRQSLWTQIVTDITEVTKQGGHSFEMYVQKERESLDILAENLRGYDSDDSEAMLIFNKHANNKSDETQYSGYFSLAVFGDGDSVTTYLAGGNEPKTGSKSDYSNYGDSGISEPYLNNYTGQETLGYYKRFTFADNVQAIVRKGQLMAYVNKEFSLSFYNNAGFSYIVKNTGDIIIRPTHKNSDRTGTNIIEILEYTQGASEAAAELQKALKKGQTGAMLSTEGAEERVITFVPLNGIRDWYIVSVIPNSAVSQHVEDVLNSSLALTVIIVIVFVLFVLFLVVAYLFRRRVVAKETEVKYREQLFGILANNTDDVFVLLTHGQDSAEYISPNITRVMGLNEAEVKADVRLIGKPENVDANGGEYGGLDAIDKLADGETLTYDNSARTHKITGETRYFRETVYRASIDNVDKDIIVFSDRTADKKAEAVLTDAMETAKAANKAKSAFLSNMSHDIRTPMNAILGFTELIKRDVNDPAKVLQYLGKINASGQHLLGLINDVLDMSKIESGKTVLNIQSFNLAEFVNEMDSIIRPQTKSKNQSFEIVTHRLKNEHLLGDKLRINQVLINILSNAVKYTPENGTIVMEISDLPRINENFAHLRFTISDNGLGMSEEYLKVIFNPFTRETTKDTTGIQGTGLGMAITKNLVDLLGGTISVKSELGKGSTFTVELELRIETIDVNHEFWSEFGIHRALIIDDEIEICNHVKEALEEAGLPTEYALSGQEGIDLVKSKHDAGDCFSLILVDLKMPGMDGIATARQLRRIVSGDVSLLMLTSYDWSELEDTARGAGIDAFLPKPFFVSNLKLNIRNLRKEQRSAAEDTDDQPVFEGKHILAAEDNELNAEILVELLDMCGASCDLAQNGQIAVDKFIASEPGYYDLILMDVQMPVLNGYDATRAIRSSSHPCAKTVPIIAMTANAFAEDISAALDAGMDAHAAKPMNIERLEEVFRQLLKEREQKK